MGVGVGVGEEHSDGLLTSVLKQIYLEMAIFKMEGRTILLLPELFLCTSSKHLYYINAPSQF